MPGRYVEGFYVCAKCKQYAIPVVSEIVCDACKALGRAPQGEPVRLFEPAPPVMPGQGQLEL